MQAILFRIVPTALEISLVCGILVSRSIPPRRMRASTCPRRISSVGTLLRLRLLLLEHTPGLQSVQLRGGKPHTSLTEHHTFSLHPSTRFRREANQADNKAATTAVDSLINFEAVKVHTLSLFITKRYPTHDT